MADNPVKKAFDRPYQVGYGKPPKATQFGRRSQPVRTSANRPDDKIDALLDRPVRVEKGGKTVRLHAHEVTMISLAKRAVRKKIGAIREFLQECDKAGLLERPRQQTSGVVIVPKHMPSPVFKYLFGTFGAPPWDPKIRAQIEAEYERDCATIAQMRKDHEGNQHE